MNDSGNILKKISISGDGNSIINSQTSPAGEKKISWWQTPPGMIGIIISFLSLVWAVWWYFHPNPGNDAAKTIVAAGGINDSHDVILKDNLQTGSNNTQQQGNIVNNNGPQTSAQLNGGINGNGVGVNTGNLTQNQNISNISNFTIINIWPETGKYHYLSNGDISFPVVATKKMDELKKVAQTDDFKQALMPFAALGTLQPTEHGLEPDKNSIAKPISYAKLFELGALSPDTEGQERLVRIATDQRDKMRPRWRMRLWQSRFWIQEPNQVQIIQNAQKWINSYHDEMIQLGILSH